MVGIFPNDDSITRLIKKVENRAHAVALHMMYYNFVRIHKTLRVTPAMAAGVSDRLWEIADIAKLGEDADAAPAKRGPYKSGKRDPSSPKLRLR